jgi:hypothetical protein
MGLRRATVSRSQESPETPDFRPRFKRENAGQAPAPNEREAPTSVSMVAGARYSPFNPTNPATVRIDDVLWRDEWMDVDQTVEAGGSKYVGCDLCARHPAQWSSPNTSALCHPQMCPTRSN